MGAIRHGARITAYRFGLRITWTAIAFGALILSGIGHLGDASLPFANRLAYTALLVAGSYALQSFASGFLGRLAISSGPIPLCYHTASVVLAAPVVTVFVWLVVDVVFERSFVGSFGWPVAVVFVALVCICVELLELNLYPRFFPDWGLFRPMQRTQTANTAGPPASVPFVTIGGQRFRADRLRTVHSRDHYLEVKLEGGRVFMVHGRLRDLVAAVPKEYGGQVHRSWWVSYAHVAALEGTLKRKRLVLTDGSNVPVGPRFVSALSHTIPG